MVLNIFKSESLTVIDGIVLDVVVVVVMMMMTGCRLHFLALPGETHFQFDHNRLVDGFLGRRQRLAAAAQLCLYLYVRYDLGLMVKRIENQQKKNQTETNEK